jgi:hypothetical protein
MSSTCGLKEWSAFCGALKFKFFLSDTSQEITELPYKSLDWEENALEFTLKPATDADLGDHRATLNILPESYPELNHVL